MKKKMGPAKAATRPAKQEAVSAVPVNRHEPVQDVQVRIAARAHEFYVQRGRLDGNHLHDWLDAEREILRQGHGSDTTSAHI